MKLKLTLLGLVAIVATCPVAVRGANGQATDASQPAAVTSDVKPVRLDSAPLSKSARGIFSGKGGCSAKYAQPTTVADASAACLHRNRPHPPLRRHRRRPVGGLLPTAKLPACASSPPPPGRCSSSASACTGRAVVAETPPHQLADHRQLHRPWSPPTTASHYPCCHYFPFSAPCSCHHCGRNQARLTTRTLSSRSSSWTKSL